MENPGIKNGLIAGLFVVAGGLLSYFIDPKLYLSPTIQWGLMIVYLIFMYRAGAETRTANGGFISWGEAIKPVFLTGVLAALIVIVFQYVLFNFVAPELLDLQKETAMEALEQMEGFLGEEATETALERLEEEDFSFGIGSMISGWVLNCVIGFIPSAIIAAILRREDPSQQDYA